MVGIIKVMKYSVVVKFVLWEVSNIFMDKMFFVYIINLFYYYLKDKRVFVVVFLWELSMFF